MNAIRRKKNVVFQVKEYEWMVETSHFFLGFYVVKTLLNNNIAMLYHVIVGVCVMKNNGSGIEGSFEKTPKIPSPNLHFLKKNQVV